MTSERSKRRDFFALVFISKPVPKIFIQETLFESLCIFFKLLLIMKLKADSRRRSSCVKLDVAQNVWRLLFDDIAKI